MSNNHGLQPHSVGVIYPFCIVGYNDHYELHDLKAGRALCFIDGALVRSEKASTMLRHVDALKLGAPYRWCDLQRVHRGANYAWGEPLDPAPQLRHYGTTTGRLVMGPNPSNIPKDPIQQPLPARGYTGGRRVMDGPSVQQLPKEPVLRYNWYGEAGTDAPPKAAAPEQELALIKQFRKLTPAQRRALLDLITQE